MTDSGRVTAALPPGALPFERALAAGFGDTLEVPYRRIMDPAQAPAAFLPFLAGHRSVDLWFDDWSEARRRAVVSAALTDARLKGTRSGSIRFLGYVDATLVDAVAYPARFVAGRARLGRTPIGHPAFLARYLVRVATETPPRAFVAGRAVLGRARCKTPDRTPIERCLIALRAAKAPESEIRVDFAHHRRLALRDAPLLDGSHRLGDFVARTKL